MRISLSLLLALTTCAIADDSSSLPYDLQVRTTWSPVVITPGGDEWHARPTLSAHRYRYAVDTATGKPFVGDAPAVDPERIARAFRVENVRPLLGEPIVVTLTITNRGVVAYREWIGGNYRARGRDDNFRFLLQREDGTFVDDPYGPMDFSMGGMMGQSTIEPTMSKSLHQPLQQWCAITAPGKYTLHCLYSNPGQDVIGSHDAAAAALTDEQRARSDVSDDGRLIDKATGKDSGRRLTATWKQEPPQGSPLAERMPASLREYVSSACDTATDYAAISLEIVEGTPSEREAMRKRWLGRVSFADEDEQGGFHAAAKIAMLFVQQDDWMDAVERDAAPRADRYPVATAMGMHPAPRALKILTGLPPDQVIGGTYWMPAERKRDAVPLLIGLMSPDQDVRIQRLAAQRLTHLTGQVFDDRIFFEQATAITTDEFAAMRVKFEAWWRENRDTFTPRSR